VPAATAEDPVEVPVAVPVAGETDPEFEPELPLDCGDPEEDREGELLMPEFPEFLLPDP
jgi:hypothetical protein